MTVCLLGATGAASADPVQRLTFIELRSDAADRGRALLDQYARADSLRSSDASVLVLQDSARPERFVLLEEAPRAEDLQPALPSELDGLLAAPPDRRTHRELDGAAAAAPAKPGAPSPLAASSSAPTSSAGATSTAVYVVSHLDMTPPERAKGEAALQRITAEARKSAGNLRFDVWQQTDRSNHFNLIAMWTSRAKFNDFAAGAAAREFRKSVASSLGSPYDERLYRRVN
jgi:quinol monooxygenase YgiN